MFAAEFIKDRYHEVVQATAGFARIAKTVCVCADAAERNLLT
jgi:hypothetical protein